MDDLFEIMQTTRSMRRLKPDPVPDELIRKILEAGAVRGERRQHAALALPGGEGPEDQAGGAGLVQEGVRRGGGAALRHQRAAARRHAGALQAPAFGGGVSDRSLPRGAGVDRRLHRRGHGAPTRWSGASIYPAVQNMLLATRALGLGSTLTTRHLLYEKEAEAAMGLPEGVHSYAILPIGYPMGNVRAGRPRQARRHRLPGQMGPALRRDELREAKHATHSARSRARPIWRPSTTMSSTR